MRSPLVKLVKLNKLAAVAAGSLILALVAIACTARVATTTARLSGRLVAVDLRRGVTLAIPVESAREMADGNALKIAQVPIADILTLEGEPCDPGVHDPVVS